MCGNLGPLSLLIIGRQPIHGEHPNLINGSRVTRGKGGRVILGLRNTKCLMAILDLEEGEGAG